MSISFSGVGSGLPIDEWITALVKIEQDKVDSLTKDKEALQKKQTTLNTLKSEYSAVQTATQKLTDSLYGAGSDIFSKVNVSASDTSVVTATVTQYATPSSLDLEVFSLATATKKQSYEHDALRTSSNKLSELGVTTSGNFEINGATINVTPDMTIDSLIYQINNSSQANVKASLSKGHLVIESRDNGAKEIEITGTDLVDGTHNFAELLGLQDTSTSRSTDKLDGLTSGSVTLADLGVTKDSAVFKINEAEITITSDMTVDDFISAVNSSSAGVTAALDDGRLVFENKAGNTEPITFGGDNVTDTKSLSQLLGLDDRMSFGSNAEYSIDGIRKTASSNILSSDDTGILGLSLELLTTTDGEPVTLDIERDYDSEAPLTALQEFVDAFNKLIKDTDTNTDGENGGILTGENNLVTIRNNLRSMITSPIDNPGVYRSLADIGITTGAPGLDVSADTTQLVIDKDKFIEAFEKSPASVKALLVGDNTGGNTVNGVMQEVQEKLKPALDAKGGYFTARTESLTSQIKNLSNKIDKKQEYVYSYQERLTKQFNYMDQMIAQMNAQFSQMQQQLKSIGVEVGG